MEKKEYLQTLKVVELKKICKDSHILGVHSKKKSELIELMCDCVLTGLDALTTEKHQPKHPTITNEFYLPKFKTIRLIIYLDIIEWSKVEFEQKGNLIKQEKN